MVTKELAHSQLIGLGSEARGSQGGNGQRRG
jgi:hypothetical protein